MQDYFKRSFVLCSLEMKFSDQNANAKSNRNRNCISSFPWESQGSHVVLFLLCFTYPSYLPLQTDTYIDELVEKFLKLSVKAVQVDLIIGTTLSCFKAFSCAEAL